ncbi:MAG: tetratricopeptide repeat protein, partial [Methylococcales bacterium]|nr:tetratricopeptide repeat protein [Methylococcales bacterium]
MNTNLFEQAVAQQSKAPTLALKLYKEHLKLNPKHLEALNNMGVLLYESGKYNESTKCFEQAIQINPDHAMSYYNKGYIQLLKHQNDKAENYFRKACQLNNKFAESFNNLGMVLRDKGEYHEALTCFNHTIHLDPTHTKAHYGKALILLLKGEFKQGLIEYEWRWKHEDNSPRKSDKPLWNGEDLNYQTLFVYTEQGFGDAIQFIRLISNIKEKYPACHLLFECKKPLFSLFQTAVDINELFIQGQAISNYHYHIPLLSILSILDITFETIPTFKPYLFSAPPYSIQLNLKKDRLNVGFVWAGNPQHINDYNRSSNLKAYSILFQYKNIDFYSLQKGIRANEITQYLTLSNVHDLSHHINSFADTAEIISQLDLIISVDTSTTHLSAALSKKTWLLLPYIPEWRWLENRSDSPWYPSIKIYRQSSINNWQELLYQVKNQLIEYANTSLRKPLQPRRLSENVGFRQNKAKFGEKAQFTGVNEHFEPNFNAVLAERCVFGQPPSPHKVIPTTTKSYLVSALHLSLSDTLFYYRYIAELKKQSEQIIIECNKVFHDLFIINNLQVSAHPLEQCYFEQTLIMEKLPQYFTGHQLKLTPPYFHIDPLIPQKRYPLLPHQLNIGIEDDNDFFKSCYPIIKTSPHYYFHQLSTDKSFLTIPNSKAELSSLPTQTKLIPLRDKA